LANSSGGQNIPPWENGRRPSNPEGQALYTGDEGELTAGATGLDYQRVELPGGSSSSAKKQCNGRCDLDCIVATNDWKNHLREKLEVDDVFLTDSVAPRNQVKGRA
jgi:hypothetical protein